MKYSVVSQEEDTLTIEASFAEKFGEFVLVEAKTPEGKDEQLKGLTKADNTVWVPGGFIKDGELLTCLTVELIKYSILPPSVEQLVPDSFFYYPTGLADTSSILRVTAKQRGLPGQLQWKFTHQPLDNPTPRLTVAIGHDGDDPGHASAKFPGYFPVGVYFLNGTLYSKEGAILKVDSRVWTVLEPTNQLYSGRSLDLQLPLFT